MIRDRSKIAASWANAERSSLLNHLGRDLKTMQRELERAIASLESGGRINELLMQHAGSISAQVGRWNLLREMGPLVGGEEE